MKAPTVYMLTNAKDGVIYIGVTSNLEERIYQHRSGAVKGFTQKYQCKQLAYVEHFGCMEGAITREKQLKGWRRSKKIALIEQLNPEWENLSETWF